MARIILLGVLLGGVAVLLVALNSSSEAQEDPLANWNMRQEMHDMSDIEHNRWRREMDIDL